MKRSWYSRMLFSYFPVFLLVVSVLIFLAFMIITELSRSETQKPTISPPAILQIPWSGL